MTRFIACADLHLGKSPDLDHSPGERLAEQEQVWRQIIDLAGEREADAILFAGDAFEGPLVTPEQYVAFARPAEDATCPIVMCLGNGRHDSAVRATTAPEVLRGIKHLRVSSTPESFKIVDRTVCDLYVPGGVTICTLPWTPVSRLVAQAGGGDRDRINEQAAELLVRDARGLRESTDGPAVLLAHWSVSGSSLPTGLPVDQLREPVLPLVELEYMGFDAVALGHIHRAQELAVDPAEPNIPFFYCGSPLALDFGEWAVEHGCWVLEISDDPVTGSHIEFVPLQSRKLERLEFDADDIPSEFAEALVMDAIVKVRVHAKDGQTVDVARIRSDLEEAGAYKVAGVTVDVERQARARIEGLSEETSAIDALAAYLTSQGVNGTVGEALLARAQRYLEVIA